MMPNRIFFVLLAVISILSIPQKAKAQSSAATKLKKNLVGVWKMYDLEVRLNEKEATAEERAEFVEVQKEIAEMRNMMLNNLTFTFSQDGSYVSESYMEGEKETEKGTWKLSENILQLTPQNHKGNEYIEATIVNNSLLLNIIEGAMTLTFKLKK